MNLFSVEDMTRADSSGNYTKSSVLRGSNVLQDTTQLEDEVEQLNQIDTIRTMEEQILEEQQQESNNEELIQLEEWEHTAFLLQHLQLD